MSNRLDPNKLFVTNAITRAGIAEDLNEVAIDEAEDDADQAFLDEGDHEFSPDDPRLTDDVCRDIANSIGEIAEENEDATQQARWDTFVEWRRILLGK